MECMLEGLPNLWLKNGCMAAATSGSIGVVAA
jgi:hypothetical protein